jgi:transposase
LSDKNIMDKDAYIKQLEDRIIQLEKRIEELERLLGMNSKNSSKPPSSDPPGMTTALPRKLRRKKRGAKNGHQPHLRDLLPEEFIQKHIHLKPEVCTCGSTNIEETDHESMRHQVVDIPPIKPQVTEYVQPVFRCKDCGEFIYKPLPDDVKRQYFGPGVLAIVAVLTGMLNISKRKALAMMNQVFSIPMSLGGLSNCEAQLANALEQPYNEVAQHVRVQQTAHADETGWPIGNRQKGWLWTLCCSTAAFFMVHAHRGQDAAQKLLGTFAGVLHCDRWSGYNRFSGLRQLCWAHLKRDFQALSECKGAMGQIGNELFHLAKHILYLRKRVRDGTLTWQTFQRRMEPLMKRTEKLLADGANCGQTLSGRCRRILNLKQHLWTFVQDATVEPTNNLAERIVRQGVLWRKGSFGTQSERGGHYVERILTVCATCRLQGRSVIEYLRDICHCHLNDIAVPSLINPAGGLNNSA